MNSFALTKGNIFAILLIPFVWIFELSIVGPSLASLAAAFPGASTLQIQLIMVSPLFTSIIFSVVSGKLTKYINKKTITIVGLLIYAILGIAPAFASDIGHVIWPRVLMGIGVGLVLPMPNAYIADYFSGKKREKMFGFATGVSNVANIVNSLLSGFLLTFGWQYIFYSFGIVFIIMIVSIVALPKGEVTKKAAQSDEKKSAELIVKLPPVVFALAAFMILNWIFFNLVATNYAFYLTEYKLASGFMIGLSSMFMATGATLAGFSYSPVRKLLKSWHPVISIFIFSFAYFTLYNATNSLVLVTLANFLVGVGSTLLVPFIFELTAQKTPHEQTDMAFGIVSGSMHLGILLAPFAQVLLTLLISNNSTKVLFFTLGVILLVVTVAAACIILVKASRTKKAEGQEADS